MTPQLLELLHEAITWLKLILGAIGAGVGTIVVVAFRVGRVRGVEEERDRMVAEALAEFSKVAKQLPLLTQQVATLIEEKAELRKKVLSEFPKLRERLHVAEVKLGLSPSPMRSPYASKPRASRPDIEDEEE